MTGCSAVNASTWSATATAATVPAETFKNCLRDKNMGPPPTVECVLHARATALTPCGNLAPIPSPSSCKSEAMPRIYWPSHQQLGQQTQQEGCQTRKNLLRTR